MCKKLFVLACVLGLVTSAAQAAQIDLKGLGINADFEDYTSIGDGVATTGWASVLGSAGGLIVNAIPQDDEFYTNPSSFGSGWQSNGTAGLSGKYGLQHPKKTTQNDMSAPFDGNFIGFVNLDDGDGLSQSIQSAIVGNLVPGVYTLTVAVGARPSTSWNDVRYEVCLMANPIVGAPDNAGPALGSRDGTVLGTPATVTLVSATAVLGANNQDLVYTLVVDANDPNVGAPFAIRINVFNALQQNGVADDGTNNGAVAPGTNYRFTQGNCDNVRLNVVQVVDLEAQGIDADFEDYTSIGDGLATTGWASVLGSAGGLIANAIPQDDEFYTNPSRFGPGWQSNGTAGLNGKYGLQHPKKTAQNNMAAPFNGDFIGFVNLDDGDGLSQSIQSGIVGSLVEGTYTLTVAVAARPSTSWNDVRYEISLVANPVVGAPDNAGPALGSRDGTVLGTPATVTLVSATAVLGSNSQDLVYTFTVDANDPNLGAPFAIRIGVFNALQQNGVADDGVGGTNYRFTQGNFDNLRLTVESKTLPVPEPVEEPKALINGSFEEPAAQAGFDNVPGWSTSAPAANSGTQVDPNASDGAQTAYLAGGDPAISQMSSLAVEANGVPELKVDARTKTGAASLKMTLFAEVLGIRMPMATQDVALSGSMTEYVLRAEGTAAFAGSVIGVELACVGGPDMSVVVDNVRMSLVQ